MKLLERRFTYRLDADCWRNRNHPPLVSHWMRDAWDIPLSARELWLSLHTTPARNRVRARIVRGDTDYYPEIQCDDEEVCPGCGRYGSVGLDKYLEELIGTTVWIEASYR